MLTTHESLDHEEQDPQQHEVEAEVLNVLDAFGGVGGNLI